MIELLKSRARGFVYTTGLPPASPAAAIAALKILREEPARCARPQALARGFTNGVGLAPPESAIVSGVQPKRGARGLRDEAAYGKN